MEFIKSYYLYDIEADRFFTHLGLWRVDGTRVFIESDFEQMREGAGIVRLISLLVENLTDGYISSLKFLDDFGDRLIFLECDDPSKFLTLNDIFQGVK